MEISFINHASVVFDCGTTKILTDPWYQGLVFDNGWSLLNDEEIDINEIDFNHLWYSHEHPDHFNLPDLLAIKESKRKDITILFQKTKDQKVKKFCESKGFLVQELDNGKPFFIDGVKIICGQCGHDSWLSVNYNDTTALNLNDCRIETCEDIHKVVNLTGEVNILLTQYGSANWTGNSGDKQTKQRSKEKVFFRTDNQIRYIKPEIIIPFASFCYFCHEQNQFCNQDTVNIREFVERYPEESLWVPYSNERLSDRIDNEKNIVRWEELSKDIKIKSFGKRESLQKLNEGYQRMKSKLKAENDMELFKQLELDPCTIFLTDLDQLVLLDLSLDTLNTCDTAPDISMSSEALSFVFKHAWGRGTLMINGRFESGEDIGKFFRQTQLYYMNNVGKRYPETISNQEILNTKSFVFEVLSNAANS